MNDETCGTCFLTWHRSEKHPPCLKLSPDERRALGATAAALGQSQAGSGEAAAGLN